MVDEQSLSWSSRSLCQSFLVAEHIDKARLAHIASTNEGILWLSSFGHMLTVGAERVKADDFIIIIISSSGNTDRQPARSLTQLLKRMWHQ